ncbi:MAG: hypothetical protein ABL308_01560 [Oceanicaulis sp.]
MRFAATASALAGLALAIAAPAAAQTDIEVTELGAVDPFEVDAGGSLPDTVWSSGAAESLRAVLGTLPDSRSAGWRDAAAARLALDALLSGGDPPEGARGAHDLAAMRAGRALAAGRAETVQRLLMRTPNLENSALLSRLFAETSFATGRTAEACRTADALIEGRDAPYWLRARAACLAFNGSIPAAELTAELARAQAPNPEFDALFDALTLDTGLPEDVRPVSGLQLALAVAIAPDTRIEAGEAAPGWLKRATERTGPPFTLPETLPEALEAAVQLEGAEREAALGALIQQDLDRVIAAEALAIRLEDAAAADEFVEAALAYGPEVARLPITADTLAHGPAFVLAALAADDVVAAEAWREALMDGPPREAEPAPALQPATVDGPADMTAPPASSADLVEAPEWTPPPARTMVAIDFASAVASGRIETDAFAALLAARIEGATPKRLCQAAGLVALGADDGGELRAAMAGLKRDADASAPLLAPALLAAAGGALGETQLLAARLVDLAPDNSEACAGAAFALDRAGLRTQALRLILEQVIEEAA